MVIHWGTELQFLLKHYPITVEGGAVELLELLLLVINLVVNGSNSVFSTITSAGGGSARQPTSNPVANMVVRVVDQEELVALVVERVILLQLSPPQRTMVEHYT